MADSTLSPPPGGDEDRGHRLLVIGTIFATISTVTILSRLFARVVVIKTLGLDDLFIILGGVSVRFLIRAHLRLTDFSHDRSL